MNQEKGENSPPEPDVRPHHAPGEPGVQRGPSPDDDLLDRIRDGDRDAVAEFVLRYEPRIRRRISGKLTKKMRSIFDSEEILSTVLHRMDVFIKEGRGEIESAAHLHKLVMQVALYATLEKGRVVDRLTGAEGEDAEVARLMLRRIERHGMNNGELLDLDAVFSLVGDATDKRILWFWLAGMQQRVIAEVVGLSHDAVRQRWSRLRSDLRGRIEEQIP